MKIHEHLRRVREEASLSQTAVAEELGVTQQCISEYESGETAIPAVKLHKFALLRKVHITVFFEEPEPKPGQLTPEHEQQIVGAKNQVIETLLLVIKEKEKNEALEELRKQRLEEYILKLEEDNRQLKEKEKKQQQRNAIRKASGVKRKKNA